MKKMSKFVIRLDDAAELMDLEKWQRMERLLDEYHVKPLIGIIFLCKDPRMKKYMRDDFLGESELLERKRMIDCDAWIYSCIFHTRWWD